MTSRRDSLRPMVEDDASFGMRLTETAGWNQTRADWIRAIRLADGGAWTAFVEDRGAGTITTCRFDAVGWIGLLLVDPEFRRQGIGRRLFERALEWLEQRGARTLRLDATPLGQPLYERYGFQVDFELQRYAGIVREANDARDANDDVERSQRPAPLELLDGADDEQVARLASLDYRLSGVDRTRLLRAWCSDPRASCLVLRSESAGTSRAWEGYAAVRPGGMAEQIGPCAARSPLAAARLLAAMLRRQVGRTVFVDVPTANVKAVELVRSAGLAPVRTLVRMTRGPRVGEQLDGYWVSGGPEKG